RGNSRYSPEWGGPDVPKFCYRPSTLSGRLQNKARIAVTGDNLQMTQAAVHDLDRQPTRAIPFSRGAHSGSLGLPSTGPQHWGASATSPRRRVPPLAVSWAVASSDFILVSLLSLLLIASLSDNERSAVEYSFASIGLSGVFVAIFGQKGGYG